jgi:hypothetical protein
MSAAIRGSTRPKRGLPLQEIALHPVTNALPPGNLWQSLRTISHQSMLSLPAFCGFIKMLWLGQKRGFLLDWITQRWVQVTGVRVKLANVPWLAGPVGDTRRISSDSLEAIACRDGLAVRRGTGPKGILRCFEQLRAPSFDPDRVDPRVRAFYEHTSAYELDAWSEWSGFFRPFGGLLAALFSRRLQQLNVPLSSLDTSRGITSEVFQVVDPTTEEVHYTAWVRELLGTGNTLYAAGYGLCRIPGGDGPCVKVVFPLPNGNAAVIMRPSAGEDGSFSLISSGGGFGDAGFYFTVQAGPGQVWARYVPQLRESIHVYAAPDGLRADHVLTLWGATFLRMHYRMRMTAEAAGGPKLLQMTAPQMTALWQTASTGAPK